MDLRTRVNNIYKEANRRTGGALEIVRTSIDNFGNAQGSEAAAGMAYYTLFSLFPLLLALVAAGSIVLNRQSVFEQVVSLIGNAFPISNTLIEENLREVLTLRGPVGLFSLLVALWSATGAFTVLTRNINRAWTEAPPRSLIMNRLVALGMVGALVALLVILLLLSTGLKVLSSLQLPLVDFENFYGTPLWTALTRVLPWLITFFLFIALYRWVPNANVMWSAAFWAALVVALAWELASNAFAWYIGSGLARYRIVYGSLGTLVAFLFWVYLSSWIIVFGAHLSAAISTYKEEHRKF